MSRAFPKLIACAAVLGALVAGCRKADAPSSQANAFTQMPAAVIQESAPIEARAPDAFYDPPADVPRSPGALLRSEQLTNVILPAGMQGWRILYTTMVNDRIPATAAATVFAPAVLPAGPRPVITWEHGTTGLKQKCMPSLVSAPTEGIPAREQIVANGWVVVATDYSFAEKDGPHPYIIGEGEARAALDAVRAARTMPELSLSNRTVVWGHSQGGHASLWTGILGPRYAPELKILGIVGIAPAANIAHILELNPAVDKRLGPYLAAAYSRFYPDVKFDEAIRPEALDAAREIVNLCGFLPREDPQRIHALTETFEGPALAATNKSLAARLSQNAVRAPISMPLLIAQGLDDNVVLPAATNTFVDERCSAGQPLEYWRFEERDHGTIVQPDSNLTAPLVAWTVARFEDEPQAPGCTRKTFS